VVTDAKMGSSHAEHLAVGGAASNGSGCLLRRLLGRCRGRHQGSSARGSRADWSRKRSAGAGDSLKGGGKAGGKGRGRDLGRCGGPGRVGVSRYGSAITLENWDNVGVIRGACASAALSGFLQDLSETSGVGNVENTVVGCALAGDVGDEHLGQRVEEGSAIRAARDGHGGTVHVYLPVPDFIEPSPSKSGVAAGDILGDWDVELADALEAGVVTTVYRVGTAVLVRSSSTEVTRSRNRAPADQGVDGLPLGLVSRGRVLVSQ